MNDPDDEVSLFDQADVFLCQSLEQRIESQSTAHLARTASIVTPPLAGQDKHPVRLFRTQMHEELSAAKQKLRTTVMAQRAISA